jgi:hypothetical protein
MGQKEWLRFFALMGTAIAIRERSPPVPNTPTSRRELIEELTQYARTLDVANRLRAYGNAMQTIRGEQSAGTKVEDGHYYLLILDPPNNKLTISGFGQNEIIRASAAYLEAEKAIKSNPGTDAVLVSVDSLAALERAYPNYFADTRIFLELMDQALTGRPRRVHAGQLKLALE